jgi:hypothetical protein
VARQGSFVDGTYSGKDALQIEGSGFVTAISVHPRDLLIPGSTDAVTSL